MSVICQTFVQNAWKKEICSNCFKSKEEHGGGGGGRGGGGGTQGGGRGDDVDGFNSKGLSRSLDGGVGGSKRYMGVAGSVYQRSYYNRNSWKSMMLDQSDTGLKSPGLIKGMSNLVSHENEKNLKLSDMMDSDNRSDSLRSSRLVQHVKTSQSEAKLLSELLGNGLDNDRVVSEKKKEPDKPYIEDKGDVSSDLGSEASNDISSTSSASSSSSYEVMGSAANSDTTSVKSDAGSEQFEGERDEYLGRNTKELNGDGFLKNGDPVKHVTVNSILKKAGDPKGTRGSISFSTKLEEVIGYGGDVDYSDDEDMMDDDDDDDFDDFMDLTPDERVLRRLTEKNTDFNSDNDNLKKDIEELLPSVKELEEKRKMIIAEIEELERLGRENRSKTDKAKQQQQEEKKEEKPEGKVKLKRSPPLVTIKPLIARNNNEVRVNQVLPMKNGEIVRPGLSNEVEDVPLKGIKPKYVSREDEMIEKIVSDDERKINAGKVTSIDDFCLADNSKKEKVTSIDDVCAPVVVLLVKIDNLLMKTESQVTPETTESKEKPTENSNIETLPSLSVTPNISAAESKKENLGNSETVEEETHTKPSGQECKERKSKSDESVGNPADISSDTKDLSRNAPVSAPRKSLSTTSKECKEKELNEDFSNKAHSNTTEPAKEPPLKANSEPVKELVETIPKVQSKEESKVKEQSNAEIKATAVTPEQQNQADAVPNETVNSGLDKNLAVNHSSSGSHGRGIPTRRLSLNHEILEIQTYKEPLKVSASIPDEKLYASQSEIEVPRTPEHSKTPASRQGSTSSLFTTFGTPVITSTAQNSFLHSSSSRSMYDDGNSSSPVYSPATTDFLKEIKSHPEVPTPTAGIQKSALYASTSCLKGLPGAKPVITPKPPILKDKPKVPFKPSGSTSRIYATPSPIIPKGSPNNLSGAVSTPNLPGSLENKGNTPSTLLNSSPEATQESTYKAPSDQKKPPPTTQAPAIPVSSGIQNNEVVYDIPVTIASSQSSNSEPLSSRSSLKNGVKVDDATIYHEIDDSLKTKVGPGINTDKVSNSSTEAKDPADIGGSPANVARVESTRCQSRSTFEANRSLLSAALDFGSKALRSSSSKRTAPQPPEEETDDGGAKEVTSVVESADSEPSPGTTENVQDGIYEDYTRGVHSQEAPVQNDNNDGESYSSFTDDFDDDEDEEDEQAKLGLRKAERSSSAIPFYRNSVGPILTHDLETIASVDPNGEGPTQGVPSGWDYGNSSNRSTASRSHSVPRVTEHMVNIITDPSPTSTSGFSSKFSFGRSGFFRPSSPPTLKRNSGKNNNNNNNSSSERGRDRTKKSSSSTSASTSSSSSRFSLKKLLRLGSRDDEKKSQKEQEKRLLRESKKGKLQIIHPLDYNQNGVEVIARPEKTSPIYDYTGIYGYIPPPRMSSKIEDLYGVTVSSSSQVPPVQASSPAPSLGSKRSELSSGESASTPPEPTSATPAYAVSSTIPTASAKASCTSPIPSVPSTSNPSTSSSAAPSSVSGSSSNASHTSSLEKRSSFLKKESHLERCESSASHTSNSQVVTSSSTPTHHHLGYNSEGRPKPPPPPRKVSLENSQPNEIYSSVADLATPKRPHPSESSAAEAPSRPQRPPPPTRTPSNAGQSQGKAGPPRPDPPKIGRDSVYANLGDVRAPITPRKPGRSASIRGDEDREKRRAPQPPHGPPQLAQEIAQQQRTIRHQHQDSTSSSCSSMSSTARSSKGPAPPRPQQPQYSSNDYETYDRDAGSVANYCSSTQNRSASPVLYDAPLPASARSDSPQDIHTPDGYIIPAQLTMAPRVTQIAVGSTTSTVMSTSRIEEVYKVPQNNSQTVDAASAPSLRQEKTGRLSVRRGSAVTHRTLEDQYGAVISANLEALSNMLDQLSSNCCPPGYEEVSRRVKRWEDTVMDEDIVVGAGPRLFYQGVAFGKDITLMLTPETKVDAHHLLTTMPITEFKDQLPTHLVSHKTIIRGKTTPGTVWVLPSLNLTTLRTLADESLPDLLKAPLEWERQTCLLLLQYVTALKQLQAQGVEETCIELTLAARGSDDAGQDSDPRVIIVPPVESGIPLKSLCECAAITTLMLMGVEPPESVRDWDLSIPAPVPSQRAFRCLLQLLNEEKAGSLTKVKCILEVLLFGPDNSGNESKTPEEVEAALERWLDLERATVLHTLIRGPLQSSVLTKYHLLFLVRTTPRVLRETMKLFEEKEETSL
ncbi:streptococcal hemagglutinin [Macrobrachium rosenbergii]|uniref:streptococcal hemagglutinin n=1 Tax=Macrobrachium rosenbergii TaxID=79674 RepID=UPI0034D64D4C